MYWPAGHVDQTVQLVSWVPAQPPWLNLPLSHAEHVRHRLAAVSPKEPGGQTAKQVELERNLAPVQEVQRLVPGPEQSSHEASQGLQVPLMASAYRPEGHDATHLPLKSEVPVLQLVQLALLRPLQVLHSGWQSWQAGPVRAVGWQVPINT